MGFLDCLLQEVSVIQMTQVSHNIQLQRYHMTRDITTKPVCGTWLHYIPVESSLNSISKDFLAPRSNFILNPCYTGLVLLQK